MTAIVANGETPEGEAMEALRALLAHICRFAGFCEGARFGFRGHLSSPLFWP